MKKMMTKAVLVMAALAVTISGTALAGGYEYRNVMDMDKFVASLKDARDVEYKNVFDINGFVAALKDPNEKEYRNITTIDTFVNALGDPCQTEAATPVSHMARTSVERTPLY